MQNVKFIEIGSYKVNMILDNDGQLNLYVESLDDSKLVEIETDQDTDTQFAYRFTTEEIEKEYSSETLPIDTE